MVLYEEEIKIDDEVECILNFNQSLPSQESSVSPVYIFPSPIFWQPSNFSLTVDVYDIGENKCREVKSSYCPLLTEWQVK